MLFHVIVHQIKIRHGWKNSTTFRRVFAHTKQILYSQEILIYHRGYGSHWDFIELLHDYFLVQLNKTAIGKDNIPDLVITNIPDLVPWRSTNLYQLQRHHINLWPLTSFQASTKNIENCIRLPQRRFYCSTNLETLPEVSLLMVTSTISQIGKYFSRHGVTPHFIHQQT